MTRTYRILALTALVAALLSVSAVGSVVRAADGRLLEVRLKKEVVVFER